MVQESGDQKQQGKDEISFLPGSIIKDQFEQFVAKSLTGELLIQIQLLQVRA
jgi:hypothetical protein